MRTCDRCIGAAEVLDQVIETISPALELAGYDVICDKVEIATEALAEKYRFYASPTIRVNGIDICGAVQENQCSCCSEISGTDVDCRVFAFGGEYYEVPPQQMLAETILKAVFGGGSLDGCEDAAYVLPGNLKRFFKGKQDKSKCSCSGDCC